MVALAGIIEMSKLRKTCDPSFDAVSPTFNTWRTSPLLRTEPLSSARESSVIVCCPGDENETGTPKTGASGGGVLMITTVTCGGSMGVFVGGTGVFVGGMGVFVGGTGVAVGGTGVLVDGIGVLVGGTGVSVGGTDVLVGETGVLV